MLIVKPFLNYILDLQIKYECNKSLVTV